MKPISLVIWLFYSEMYYWTQNYAGDLLQVGLLRADRWEQPVGCNEPQTGRRRPHWNQSVWVICQ